MKKNKLNFSFIHIFLYGLIINHFVRMVNGYCEREVPIKINGSCTLKYCTEEEFSNLKCVIDNEIVKTQFLSNKINLEKSNKDVLFDVLKYDNGDILIELSNDTVGANRRFFGLTKNGTYLFGNPNKMSDESFICIHSTENNYTENMNLFTLKDIHNTEYLFSAIKIGYEYYFEKYDLFNKIKYDIFFPNMTINKLLTKLEFKDNNNGDENEKTYIIFGGEEFWNKTLFKLNISCDSNVGKLFSANDKPIEMESDFELQYLYCYNIDAQKIICFLFLNNITRVIYNFDLEKEKSEILPISNYEKDLLKCIHIKNNAGSFIYSTFENYTYYINIEFINYLVDWENFTNYLPSIKYPTEIHAYDSNTNSFIKMSENKICFITKFELLLKIYLIYLYEQEEDESKKVILREYKIDTFNLYNFDIYNKLSSVIYNNFIALAFSYQISNATDYPINGGLIIFGYANSTDYVLDLEKRIVNESNLHLEIDLKSFLKIENNIFGYEYSYSQIMDVINCNNIKFYSSNDKNKIIIIYSIIDKNETIQFDFEIKEYNAFECLIEYINIVSEPNLAAFNKYPNNVMNITENETYFNEQKGEYIGKKSTYKIVLNYGLTKECGNECSLCQKYGQQKCIITNNKENNKETQNENYSEEEKKLINYMKSINVNEVNSLIKNINLIIRKVEPTTSYLIKEDNFTLVLNKLNEYNENSTVNLDFSDCEKKLRENLPPETILRIVQINIPSTNEKILNEQVKYKVYDQNNNEIDLSVCNNIQINVENKITNSSKINMEEILELKNEGIDLFNINDEFFNDICMPYSDNETNSDMILSDRVNDLFKNYSVCGDGCEYQSFNETKMTVNCICNIKQEMNDETEEGNFPQSFKSAFFYSNFGVIKCHKLFFSSKGKLENGGFLTLTIIILGNIIIFIFYIINKIYPIQNYLKKEMENTGYINKNEGNENNNKEIIYKHNQPKKTNDVQLEENNENKSVKFKNKNKSISNKHVTNNFTNDIMINNVKETENIELNIRNNQKKRGGELIQKGITFNTTDENDENFQYEKESEKDKKDNEEHLIKISSENNNEYIPPNSNYYLDNYNYVESIRYEKRSYLRILLIFLMKTEKILYTFVYHQPLELNYLRISIFLFYISIVIFLNTLIYLSDNISDKYHYKGSNLFLFSLTNNIVICVISAIIAFIVIYFFQILIQSTNQIKKLFKDEEELMKKNKEYKVNEVKKEEIKNKIEDILKYLKIKIIIFFGTEIIIMLFFLYYITGFCQVYKSTQISLIYDIIISFIFSFLISLVVSMIFSFIYYIAYKKRIEVLYNIALFVYNYL